MKTALFDLHQKNGAKFISFSGWEMPLAYRGIVPECFAVRSAAGLFDVSHMGKIDISGKDAIPFLDVLSSNAIIGKPFGKAIYTVFCNSSGGAIDDALIYPLSTYKAFAVVNAANRMSVLNHFEEVGRNYEVDIKNCYSGTGIIALQGPKSTAILELARPHFPEIAFPEIAPKEVVELPRGEWAFSRTGYTGEDGYEFYGKDAAIRLLFEVLLEVGKPLGLLPCGLGARDVLRLEKGYALYGHELSPSITPLESVASSFVKLNGRHFLGKEALEKVAESKNRRYAVGLIGLGKIPAREHYPIYLGKEIIGVITSGTFSPHLNRPIALGLIDRKMERGEEVLVEVRGERYPFQVGALPFLRSN